MNDGPPLQGLSLRVPPSNPQAEMGLLGALLSNNKGFERVRDWLKVEHFVDPVNGRIFAAIHRHLESGRAVDMVTLAPELSSGVLEEVGGIGYLAQLLAATPHPSIAPDYARAVVDTWARRQAIEVAEAIVSGSFSEAEIAGVIQAAAMSMETIAAAASRAGAGTALKSLGEAIDAALDEADAVARGDATHTLMTGMPHIDEALGGMEQGDLVVLGGRPGSGKSALALQWAVDIARREIGVLIMSMEMRAASLGRRALSIFSGVPVARMKRGQHLPYVKALIEARKEMLRAPLSIDDVGRASAARMFEMAKEAKRRHGLGLIVVDHLQIATPDAQDNRNGATAGVAGLAHAMKALAKRMECPVLLLSQLSRGVEGRDDHRPTMSDLKQSGAIEEDADIVAFVHRPEMYLGKAPPDQTDKETGEKYQERVNVWHARKAKAAGVAEFIIEKLREGETKVIPLLFDGPTTTFRQPQEVLI